MPHRDSDTRVLVECMEACVACEFVCLVCADACLAEGDLVALRRCIRLDLGCADICATTARFLARRVDRDEKLRRAVVEACARACAACAAECEVFASDHEHCRICAESCRLCAERCGRLLRDLPDTYGDTHPPVVERTSAHPGVRVGKHSSLRDRFRRTSVVLGSPGSACQHVATFTDSKGSLRRPRR